MTEPTIEVCDKCLRRCCWDGVFMCDESRYAGLVSKTRAELDRLDREHPDYYARYFEGAS